MMRKALAIGLCLMISCLPMFALAEESDSAPLILTGKVETAETMTVLAPFGGTLEDYTVRVGDRVAEGDSLFTLDTQKVYAPITGTVRGVFAEVGDTAAFVQSRYSGLCVIEPAQELTVSSTTAQGYNSEDNKKIHLGETVYLESTGNDDREGIGRISLIEGEAYTVEVTGGDLKDKDTVNIFRDEDYDEESRIGRGPLARVQPVSVTVNDGSILAIAVGEGDEVSRGDVLFETVFGTLDGLMSTSTSVRAEQDGIITALPTTAGQNVQKSQVLATIGRTDRLQLVCSVSEIDLDKVTLGGAVQVAFDSIPGQTYEGTVASIAAQGSVSDGYTEYAVYIDFDADDAVRLGMSGTATPQ